MTRRFAALRSTTGSRGRPARPLAALTLVGLLACGGDKHADDPGASSGDPPPASSSSGAARDRADGAAGDDAYTSIEGLEPRERASWPVENVDIARYAGWRIEHTGAFAYEDGLVFETDADAFVLAIADGEIAEVERDADDQLALTLDHGEGIRSHYAPLTDVLVHAGMPVARGAAIGLSGAEGLRLRVLVDGVAIDPALVLGQPLHRWPARLRSLPPPPAPPAEP